MYAVYVLLTFFSMAFPKPESLNIKTHIPNNGKYTWNVTGPEGGYIGRVMVDPQDANLAIAIGFNAWITRDGTNWQLLKVNTINSFGTFTGTHRLLYYNNDTLFYSSDGAFTFTPIKLHRYYAMTERVSDTVLVIYDSAGTAYLGKTIDGGLNWSVITPLPYYSYYAVTYAPSNDSIIYLAVKINYSSDSVYIVKSENGGLSWTVLSSVGENVYVRDIEVNPQDPQEVFVSCGFDALGLIHTQDGFQTIDTVPQILLPFDVEFTGTDSVLVASAMPVGIYRGTKNPLIGWLFVPVDSLTNCTDLERSQDTVWYAAALTGMLKSTDNAISFYRAERGLYATFTYFEKSPSEMINRTVYFPSLEGNALYVSNNGGLTWEKKYLRNVVVIFDVETYPGDENIVYIAAGSAELNLFTGLSLHNILYSSDGGNTFIPMDTFTANPDSLTWIETITTVKDSPDVIIGIKREYNDTGPDRFYVMRSNNRGHSFNAVAGPFISHYDGFAGKAPLFFQADSVVYVSRDFGTTFDTLFVLNNADVVDNLSYYSADSTLFFNFYNGDTIYSYKIGEDTCYIYYVPGLYLLYAASNGGVYSLATQDFENVYFYSGTYLNPVAFHEQNNILSGAIRASENEVLLFTYGMGVYRSQDAVSYVFEKRKKGLNSTRVMVASNGILHLGASLAGRNVTLYSVTGQKVGIKKLDYRGNLNLSHLPSGVYFVKTDRIIKVLKPK